MPTISLNPMTSMVKPFGFVLLACLSLICCTPDGFQHRQNSIEAAIAEGQFSRADSLIALANQSDELDAEQRYWLEVTQATIDRIRIDFDVSRDEVRDYLVGFFPDLTVDMIERWEQSGVLEMRVIDGEKKYFSLAGRNLFRIDPEARKVWQTLYPPSISRSEQFNMKHAEEVIGLQQHGEPVLHENFTIDYMMKVKADVVPAGETIHCWMPFPRVSLPRQDSVALLEASNSSLELATPEAMQRSVYMTSEALADAPTTFSLSYRFQSAAQWFDPEKLVVLPYDTTSELYHQHTAERRPQIIFSPLVKQLADSLAGSESNPYKLVRTFYYWINENIPWASALEYSIIDCIPDYVITRRHGDCGMQTFLFMSLCRYKGIPVKWQSGWHVHPGNKNLHDWCEVYYEGSGWVPVDVSFGLLPSDDIRVREFYITGIDAYRLIVNDDFSATFTPPKKYYRSEPYDFQRGEFEWSGGNLYFNQWTYAMTIHYEKDYE